MRYEAGKEGRKLELVFKVFLTVHRTRSCRRAVLDEKLLCGSLLINQPSAASSCASSL